MTGPRRRSVSVALLFGSRLASAGRAEAVDLNGAWAGDADQCAKVFVRQEGKVGYLGSRKSLSASFDGDIEIITAELQKIQFAGAAGAYYGSACRQVVDAYGRVTTRC
jgi:hypothetical protein